MRLVSHASQRRNAVESPRLMPSGEQVRDKSILVAACHWLRSSSDFFGFPASECCLNSPVPLERDADYVDERARLAGSSRPRGRSASDMIVAPLCAPTRLTATSAYTTWSTNADDPMHRKLGPSWHATLFGCLWRGSRLVVCGRRWCDSYQLLPFCTASCWGRGISLAPNDL